MKKGTATGKFSKARNKDGLSNVYVMVLWMQLGHFSEMQREAMGMYTGVIPYLWGVVHHVKRRWGFQRLQVVGNPDVPTGCELGTLL
ncbi:hypothetical protein CFP56_024234 [Quercus suber]|uniref:Uncharacterized protein n=1 Tax=Quercus suber TaxID=58331 RepID=A0AAW0MCR5_QUESU